VRFLLVWLLAKIIKLLQLFYLFVFQYMGW